MIICVEKGGAETDRALLNRIAPGRSCRRKLNIVERATGAKQVLFKGFLVASALPACRAPLQH